MDKQLQEMIKAYATLRQAMVICGWEHLYDKVNLSARDTFEINFYAEYTPRNDYPLCCIIRGILFDQIPELYKALK